VKVFCFFIIAILPFSSVRAEELPSKLSCSVASVLRAIVGAEDQVGSFALQSKIQFKNLASKATEFDLETYRAERLRLLGKPELAAEDQIESKMAWLDVRMEEQAGRRQPIEELLVHGTPEEKKVLQELAEGITSGKSKTDIQVEAESAQLYWALQSHFNGFSGEAKNFVQGRVAKSLQKEIYKRGILNLLSDTEKIPGGILQKTGVALQESRSVIRTAWKKILPARYLELKNGLAIQPEWIDEAIKNGVDSVAEKIAKHYRNRILTNEAINQIRKGVNYYLYFQLAVFTKNKIMTDYTYIEAKKNQGIALKKKRDEAIAAQRKIQSDPDLQEMLSTDTLTSHERDLYGPDPEFKIQIESLQKEDPLKYQLNGAEFKKEKASWYAPMPSIKHKKSSNSQN
jgi:hypothetical protein